MLTCNCPGFPSYAVYATMLCDGPFGISAATPFLDPCLPRAAFGRNQDRLAQRRGDAEKSKIGHISDSTSLRLCARYDTFCLQDLHHLH